MKCNRLVSIMSLVGAVVAVAGSLSAQPLVYSTSKSAAVNRAMNEGKLIVTEFGRPDCAECRATKALWETPEVKRLLLQGYVPWELNIDASTEWQKYAIAAGLYSFSLPLICWLDPNQPDSTLLTRAGVPSSANMRIWLNTRAQTYLPILVTNLPSDTITSGSFTVQGWAQTNAKLKGSVTGVPITRVLYRLQSESDWRVADGTTNWSAPVAFTQATNIFECYAQYENARTSITNRVPFIYSGPLQLPPTLTKQPASQTNSVGGNAQFSVTAVGSQPLSYQWRFNGVDITAGGNLSTLTLTNLHADAAGQYSVVVSNAFGVTNSAVANLTVLLAPTVTIPADQTVAAGNTATFSVVAAGEPTLFYQWYKDGVALTNGLTVSGATTNVLTVSNVQTNEAGSYFVTVTNAFGSATSPTAKLTIKDVVGPVLQVTSHASFQGVTSASVTLAGTASDAGAGNSGIISVKVNGSRAANDTAVTSGVANWNKTVSLTKGTNTINIVATDGANVSTTVVLYLILDNTRPTIAMKQPTKNLQVGTQQYTIKGTASDNTRVAVVRYLLNNSAWQEAIGTTNWTAPVTLAVGTNSVAVYAEDLSGNRSTTNSVTFVYNPFVALTGTYNGLFFPEASAHVPTNSGFVAVTVASKGSFSGKLNLQGTNLTFSGAFNQQTMETQVTVKRKNQSNLALNLKLSPQIVDDISGTVFTNVITGTVTAGTNWVSEVQALRAYKGSKNPAAGNYTVQMAGCTWWGACFGIATNQPDGDSPATVKVTVSGTVTMNGNVADGSALVQTTTLSEAGLWPVYVSLNGGRGLVIGWLDLAGAPSISPLDWTLSPGVKTSYYTNGFGQARETYLAKYPAKAANQSAVNWTNATLVLTGGNLPYGNSLSNRIALANTSVTTFAGGVSNLTLTVTWVKGTFTGSFYNPVSKQTSKFNGVLQQKHDPLGDYFIDSGGWWLGPKGEGGNVRIYPE